MGFLRKLFNIGVTAGATVAAVKVAEKYKENNPEGVSDVNGDGKVDYQDKLEEVKKAASQVYGEASAAVKEKAPVYAEKAKQAVGNVFGDAGKTDGKTDV